MAAREAVGIPENAVAQATPGHNISPWGWTDRIELHPVISGKRAMKLGGLFERFGSKGRTQGPPAGPPTLSAPQRFPYGPF